MIHLFSLPLSSAVDQNHSQAYEGQGHEKTWTDNLT